MTQVWAAIMEFLWAGKTDGLPARTRLPQAIRVATIDPGNRSRLGAKMFRPSYLLIGFVRGGRTPEEYYAVAHPLVLFWTTAIPPAVTRRDCGRC